MQRSKVCCFLFVLISVFVVGDDGAVQDPGQQVSVFETQEVNYIHELCGTLQHHPYYVCVHGFHSALLLNSVMRAFRPEFVAARATDFIGMIKDCDEAGFPKVRGHELAEGLIVWLPSIRKT